MLVAVDSHNGASEGDAPADILHLLSAYKCPPSQRDKTLFRAAILEDLRSEGWTNRVRLDPSSSISVTAARDGIALCLQTGNVCRTYADLFKRQLLFNREKIRQGVMIVFCKEEATPLGANLATYERLNRELKVFESIITLPLVVLGLQR